MDNMPNIRTLTIKEIAELTNIPERKVLRLVRSGKLPDAGIDGKETRVYEVDVYNSFRPKTTDSYRCDNN
jgi:excisionase family DNA binding protein